jgi:hypothetical protein
MAIHRLTLPFAQLRGTMHNAQRRQGLTLSDHATQGLNSRRYCPHQRPATDAQLRVRTAIAAAAKAWAALPSATADAWRALAAQLTRNNSLGYTYRLTGIAVWNQVQLYRQLDGLAISSAVPNAADVPPPVSWVIQLSFSLGILSVIAAAAAIVDPCYALLRITSSSTNQARRRQPGELRIPTANTALSIVKACSNCWIWDLAPNTVSLAENEFVGVEFVPMSPAYLPRPAQFFPLKQLIAP